MTRSGKGRPLLAALFLGLLCLPAGAQEIAVRDGRTDALLASLPLSPGTEVCLRWSHSVTGGPVADCFEIREGRLVLTRSYLHDFAAGLGHLPGRGMQRPAAEGGYWIEGIDEPVAGNALAVRVGGPSVGHRLDGATGSLDLTALAAGRRVRIVPAPSP